MSDLTITTQARYRKPVNRTALARLMVIAGFLVGVGIGAAIAKWEGALSFAIAYVFVTSLALRDTADRATQEDTNYYQSGEGRFSQHILTDQNMHWEKTIEGGGGTGARDEVGLH